MISHTTDTDGTRDTDKMYEYFFLYEGFTDKPKSVLVKHKKDTLLIFQTCDIALKAKRFFVVF